MRWVILTCILVTVAFVGMYISTREVWSATNAAGVIIAVYLVILVAWATRELQPRWRRIVWRVSIAVVFAGMTIHWVTMYSMTTWQYQTLHTIRKTVFHIATFDFLQSRGLKTLQGYYTRNSSSNSLAEVFNRLNPRLEPSTTLLDTLPAEDGMRIHAVSVSDSEIVLIGMSTLVEGEEPNFQNYDGHLGRVQNRLKITPRGLSYEIQN
jgi:hypothetical protein